MGAEAGEGPASVILALFMIPKHCVWRDGAGLDLGHEMGGESSHSRGPFCLASLRFCFRGFGSSLRLWPSFPALHVCTVSLMEAPGFVMAWVGVYLS